MVKNNKGFVLVETIVTAVFVLGFFTFLIVNMLPLVARYEKNENYDTVESQYDVHMIRKMLIKDESCRLLSVLTLPESGYYEFEGTKLCDYIENYNYCKKLLSEDFLNVKTIIITKYQTSTIKNNKSDFSRTLEEYINEMPEYTNTVSLSNYDYQRRIIVEFNDGRIANASMLIDSTKMEINCGGSVC